MIYLIRTVCTLGGLAAFFFGAFFLFDGQYVTGTWALVSGVLFMFIGETVTEVDDLDDDEYDDDKFA